jgi:hypothetical protein
MHRAPPPAPLIGPPAAPLLTALVCLLAGCSEGEADSGGGGKAAELPPLDTDEGGVDETGTLPWDTSGLDSGSTDEAPAHLLTVRHIGSWILSPPGGPYTDMTGELVVEEIVDEVAGADPEFQTYKCQVDYALVGQVIEAPDCAACDPVLQVSYYVNSGTPEDCGEPDTPLPDELRQMGFVAAESSLLWNYRETGAWLAWYEAEQLGDAITLDWETTYGLTVEEEE